MRGLRRAAACAVACATSALATAGQFNGPVRPGWTGLIDTRGRCYYAIPAAWMTGDDVTPAPGRAGGDADSDGVSLQSFSPDGSVSVVVVWNAARSWEAFVGALKTTLRPVAVHVDSPHRFVVDYAPPLPGTHTYAAVRAAGGACAMYVDVLPRAPAPVRTDAGEVLDTLTALR